MPSYDITSPDGKKFRVTAPDGATQEQVLAYAQQQFAQQPKAQAAPENSSPAAAAGFGRGGKAPTQSTLNAMRDSTLSNVAQGAVDDPMGTIQAIPSGFNRGVANLAGLPVDTMANVADLGGMAYGATRAAMSGRPASEFYTPRDRSQDIGSGEWNANMLDKGAQALGGGPVTQNMSPNNPAARLAFNTASAIPGALTARGVVANAGGGAAQSAVAEAGGDPAMQAVAGLAGSRAPSARPKLEAVPDQPRPPEVLDPPLTFNGPDAPLTATGKPRGNAFTQLEGAEPPAKPKPVIDDPDAEPQGSPAREEVRKRHVQLLRDEGVRLDAAQRTGSKVKELAKRSLNDNPATAGMQARFAEKQQADFTRSVLKKIGVDEEAATPEVMGRKLDRVGQVFDDVAERNPVKYDRKLNDDLAQIQKDGFSELPNESERKFLAKQVEEIFTKAQENGGVIDGKAYQRLRTSLGNVSAQQTPIATFAADLREVLDDALQRSARKQDLMDLRVARTQYRRMKQIEGAIDEFGQISASKLANSLSTKANRRASVYGRGDTELVRLAKAGKAILPDKFPQSGSVPRFLAQLGNMNMPAAMLALGLAPIRVSASVLMNKQPKAKKPAEQPTNRLSSLGGG